MIHLSLTNINMYKIIIAFSLLLTACQHSQKPILQLSTYCYNFYELQKNKNYLGNVMIKNTGNDTLKIFQIGTSCGWTDASITQKLLQPQDSCTLNFTYNTQNKQGIQEEYISIYANTDSLVHLLKIKAFVSE